MAYQLPKATVAAISTVLTSMLAPLAISQGDIDNGIKALIDTVNGKDATNREPPDKLLTTKEVAERLHRSTKTVQQLAARGQLRRIYCGAAGARASGYSEASVAAFLSGRKEVAA